ncbi:MAG: xanthine dehydrogenase accessory factor, partial [bacterium]
MLVLQAAADAIRKGRPAALVTVIDQQGSTPRHSGARMLVYADGTSVGTVGGGAFEHEVMQRAVLAIQKHNCDRYSVHLTLDLGMCCGGRMEAFIEPLDISAAATVFGAGHVAHAVVPLLTKLGYRVTVVDERDEWLTAERFESVDRQCVDPRAFAEAMPPDPTGIVLILTHDHPLDEDLIHTLLPRDYPWIGMIGSRAKRARFKTRWLATGLDPTVFASLRSPVGLDIAAQTPF